MDSSGLEPQNSGDLDGGPADAGIPTSGMDPNDGAPAESWLEEIVARLEADPDEVWPAMESLSAVDDETRLQLIEALAAYRERPGIRDLLRLLGSARDPAVRAAAVLAMPHDDPPAAINGPPNGNGVGGVLAVLSEAPASLPAIQAYHRERHLPSEWDHPATRIVRSLVTAIDGDGRGTIVLSARDGGYWRTAAFRCDVRRGILDAVGEVEREHPAAGHLMDEWIERAGGDHAVDVPELAVRLLAGSLLLGDQYVPARVRAWLDATIGLEMESLPSGLPATFPGPEIEAIPEDEMFARAYQVLGACPGWLDRSALTLEMAEEITLREGDSGPDPVRDAGAYRYLFEHRLIGRLDIFARMLLWMGWVWHASGRVELSRSAFALAAQLADEQHAVPSHPFTVALSTLSLRAAQGKQLEASPPEAGASV
jgi:hypothetical protein